jgi:uncharacterized coiled-coil protein SlyX
MSESILPALLSDLELYLDRQAVAWQLQPEHTRLPTLPSTSDGKVNVRAITLALGRPQSQEQHLFKRPALKSVVNAVAIEQGLKPIGSRLPEDLEKAIADRMRRTEQRSSEMSKLVAEQASVIEKQRRTIESLREQLRMFEETGQVLRTAPVRS